MNRLSVIAVGLVAAAAPAADPDPRSPRDVFGRPRPHGEVVEGAFVGLSAGRTSLGFGQPVALELFAVPAGPRGPYVHPHLGEPGKNVWLELTDGDGRPVPFRLEGGGYSGGPGLETCPFELWPTPAHAVGVYWRPGTYRLRAVVEKRASPAQPHSLPGTFRTNVLTFAVAEPGAPRDRCEPDATTRERTDKLIAALDAPAAADRDAAEKALAAEADPAVLLRLEAALAGATPEAGRRLRAALKAHDQRLRRAVSGGRYPFPQQTAFWMWVGGLDEGVSERLRRRAGFDEAGWRTKAAQFAPVTVPQDRPPKPEEAARLLAELRHADPWVRMLAVRSVPRGSPPEVRAELAERLRDPYREWSAGPGDPVPVSLILYAARDSAGRIGPEMTEPLLAFASRDENRTLRGVAAEALGRTGPDPKARDFLRGLIRAGRYEERYPAQRAAVAWGKDGVELLRELLAVPGLSGSARREAIEAIGRYGDPATDGPAVHKLLAEKAWEVRLAAARAAGWLRYREALPDLERVALDTQENPHVRTAAADGVLAMCDGKTGDQLLLDLTAARHGAVVRSFAFTRLGGRKTAAAVPALLDALADGDWATRWSADAGLRALAGLAEGVGYDPRKPDPQKWRDYWAKNPR